jgi:hypothetical protein
MRTPSFRHRFAPWLALVAMAFAGAASGAEITLYEHANFAGLQLILRGWTPDISRVGFNDRASSIVVADGRWELCTDADFKGFCQTFTRGEYPVIDGRLNDRISSAREIGSYGENRGSYYDYGSGAIQLFDQAGFAGTSLQLAGDAQSLRQNGFNDRAASVIVTQGTWELCADADFAGTCRTYAPGRYPDLGYGMARQASSARLLHSANDAPAVIAAGSLPPPPGPPGRVILYSERGLRGSSLALSGPAGDLERSNFNDATASIYVESGSWLACRDSFFRGECRVFGPGRYDDLSSFGFDRIISSIRPGGDMPPPPLPPGPPLAPAPAPSALEFFSEPQFAGERLGVDGEIRDLERSAFNDRAASVVVRSGTWELCTDARFGGSCAVFRPGNYPSLGGLTRQVSSVRRIQ